jgi:hypothetical protein
MEWLLPIAALGLLSVVLISSETIESHSLDADTGWTQDVAAGRGRFGRRQHERRPPLKMIAIAAGAAAIAVEIMDRLAAGSRPRSEERRTGALTLWMVAGMLAAAALL